jgi:predicted RNase H-like HicB family nuclease
MILKELTGQGRVIGGILHIEKKGRQIKVMTTLSGRVFKEGETWVAYCQGLDLSSCGNTKEKALEAISKAITLWFESCAQRKTLEQALTQLGWICENEEGKITDCQEIKLPPAFVIDAIKNKGQAWSQPVQFRI